MLIPIAPFMLRDRLHVAEDRVELWTAASLSCYGVVVLLAAPIVGRQARRMRAQQHLLQCLVPVSLGATIMLYFASSLPMFIVARALQGVSASSIWVNGLTLLMTGGPQRGGVAMGLVAASQYLSSTCAPVATALLWDRYGYDAAFVPTFAVMGCSMTLLLLVQDSARVATSPDVEHAPVIAQPETPCSDSMLSPVTPTSPTPLLAHHLATPHVENSRHGWAFWPWDPHRTGIEALPQLLGRSAVRSLTGWMVSSTPRRVPAGFWALWMKSFVANALIVGLEVDVPPFVVQHLGWTARQTGWAVTAFNGPIIVLAPIVGTWATQRSWTCTADPRDC